MILEKDIIEHQDFFEKCANDYRTLATQLIYELANHLQIEIDAELPLKSFDFLKQFHPAKPGYYKSWKYCIHGYHCCFTNTITKQEIEVSLVNKLEFGVLDPYFFSVFILSTLDYKPLPINISNKFDDGLKIIEIMIAIAKFEKINGFHEGEHAIVLKNRNKNLKIIIQKNTALRKKTFWKKLFYWIKN